MGRLAGRVRAGGERVDDVAADGVDLGGVPEVREVRDAPAAIQRPDAERPRERRRPERGADALVAGRGHHHAGALQRVEPLVEEPLEAQQRTILPRRRARGQVDDVRVVQRERLAELRRPSSTRGWPRDGPRNPSTRTSAAGAKHLITPATKVPWPAYCSRSARVVLGVTVHALHPRGVRVVGRRRVPPGVHHDSPGPRCPGLRLVARGGQGISLVGHLGLDGRADPAVPHAADVQPVVGLGDHPPQVVGVVRVDLVGDAELLVEVCSASRTRGRSPSRRRDGKGNRTRSTAARSGSASGFGSSTTMKSLASASLTSTRRLVARQERRGVVEELEVVEVLGLDAVVALHVQRELLVRVRADDQVELGLEPQSRL